MALPPLKRLEMEALYRVSGAMELSAEVIVRRGKVRDQTPCLAYRKYKAPFSRAHTCRRLPAPRPRLPAPPGAHPPPRQRLASPAGRRQAAGRLPLLVVPTGRT